MYKLDDHGYLREQHDRSRFHSTYQVQQFCNEEMETEAKGLFIQSHITGRGILIRKLAHSSWKRGIDVTRNCFAEIVKFYFKTNRSCKRISTQLWRLISKLTKIMTKVCSKGRCVNPRS